MKYILGLSKVFTLIILCLLILVGTSIFVYAKTKPQQQTQKIHDLTAKEKSQELLKTINAQGLSTEALQTAIKAYKILRQHGRDPKGILTVIDYTLASSKPRLWVIDVKNNKLLFNVHVAHGKESGNLHSDRFSDKPRSDATSIGVYVTENTYSGKHGYSLRLRGLDVGFNDNVAKRAVVMHSASYVSKSFLKAHGRLGRSWGCPALSKAIAPKIINTIKNGTILVAYYPDKSWMNKSVYLNKN
jgi:hypothetical protein